MAKQLPDKCICPMCPSFVKCGEPVAYCLPEAGISKCIKSEVGCVCPGCPVYEQLGLSREYFCLR